MLMCFMLLTWGHDHTKEHPSKCVDECSIFAHLHANSCTWLVFIFIPLENYCQNCVIVDIARLGVTIYISRSKLGGCDFC